MKAKNQTSNGKPRVSAEDRKRRQQQILFAAMAIIIILTWVISTVVTIK
jgi:hypothetical protein